MSTIDPQSKNEIKQTDNGLKEGDTFALSQYPFPLALDDKGMPLCQQLPNTQN